MALFPEEHPRDIPELAGSDAKEVFAFVGLCLFHAQLLEQGITNLAVGLRIQGLTRLDESTVDAFYVEMSKKTLGQLISDVRRHVNVAADLEESLSQALQYRNYVAHRFFVVHDLDFMSERGRIAMIHELRDITYRLQNVGHRLDVDVTHRLWERLGLTAEMVERELSRMKDEANQKEQPHTNLMRTSQG